MPPPADRPPLLGICATGSNSGKTTLLAGLIPALLQAGCRVSVIKHAHRHFDIDHPGKDTYRIRQAGAVQTLIGSRQRWALMTELPEAAEEPDLATLAAQLDPRSADLILVEGFRHEAIPKIEVFRPAMQQPLLANSDPTIIAIASDEIFEHRLPVLDLNNHAAIAQYILGWLALQPQPDATTAP